jgi:hypothetical protein
MKAALEKEIFDLITEFVNDNSYTFKSIRCRKDDDLGLSGITISVGDDYDPKYTKSIREILETDILDSIQSFELNHNVAFKSLKSKKDKDGMLSGILITFDGDDIPVDNKSQIVNKDHLQEQIIPIEFESESLNSYDSNAIEFTYEFKIAGINYDNPDGSKRKEIIKKCSIGESVDLKRDYDNEHDKYAIAVFRKTGEQLGFIPREDFYFGYPISNRSIAEHIDLGDDVNAKIIKIVNVNNSELSTAILEIVIISKQPFRAKERRAKEILANAKKYEKINPLEAIQLYKEVMALLHEVDTNLEELNNNCKERNFPHHLERRTPYPINALSSLLESTDNYEDCIAEIEKYEQLNDPVGIQERYLEGLKKRKSKLASKI